MSGFFVILLLILNFGISWWNAYVAGASWVESKHLGGFIRLVVWSAAIQSACGFTMVFTAVIAAVAYVTGYLPMAAIQLMLSMMYLLIIVPILGSGLVITIHSWMIAWRDRSLLNMGSAAYNTFAQAYNTYQAVSGIGEALGDVTSFIPSGDDDDGKGKLFIVVALLVLIAALGGILLTATLITHYAGTRPLPASAVARRRVG